MSVETPAEARPLTAEPTPATKTPRGLHPIVAGVASGLLLWLAFPPVDRGYLVWVALVPLLLLVRSERSRWSIYFGAWLGGPDVLGPGGRVDSPDRSDRLARLGDDGGLPVSLVAGVPGAGPDGHAALRAALDAVRAGLLDRPGIRPHASANRLPLVLSGPLAIPGRAVDPDRRRDRGLGPERAGGDGQRVAGRRPEPPSAPSDLPRPPAHARPTGSGGDRVDGPRWYVDLRRDSRRLGHVPRRSPRGPLADELQAGAEVLAPARGDSRTSRRADDRGPSPRRSPT